jgi:membrane protein YdbS with pleckstrin-like domain
MAISTSKTREQFPLSSKKILKKTIDSVLAWAILMIIFLIPLLIFLTFLHFSLILFFVLYVLFFLVILIPTYIYQVWYFNVYYYDLDPDYVVIRKGPITPREITIPYERIQDVYVDQDIFDRILGLYDVHLSSATYSSGMQAHIDGVEKPAADGLRALLLQTIAQKLNKKIPETQVSSQANVQHTS